MKIGIVPYINALPLVAKLDSRVTLIKKFPSALAESLEKNEIDVALLPVFSLIQNPLWFSYFDLGIIGATQKVESVILALNENFTSLENLTSLELTPQSATSVALLKVLLIEYWGKNLDEINFNSSNPEARLIIGDDALTWISDKKPYLDLAQIWNQKTGSAFIFAGWVAKRKLTSDEIQLLKEASDFSEATVQQIASSTQDFNPSLVTHYLKECIDYRCTPAHLQGFELFKQLCVQKILK